MSMLRQTQLIFSGSLILWMLWLSGGWWKVEITLTFSPWETWLIEWILALIRKRSKMQHILRLPLGDTNQPPKGQAAFDESIWDQSFLLQKSNEFFWPKRLSVVSAQGHCCFIGTIYLFGRSSLQKDESTLCHQGLGCFSIALANYCCLLMLNLLHHFK